MYAHKIRAGLATTNSIYALLFVINDTQKLKGERSGKETILVVNFMPRAILN